MTDWIVLGRNRAINLDQVQDIEFYAEGGYTFATVRLASFNATTCDKQETSWFNVSGDDPERLRACITRRLAPEFEGQLGAGGPLQSPVVSARGADW